MMRHTLITHLAFRLALFLCAPLLRSTRALEERRLTITKIRLMCMHPLSCIVAVPGQWLATQSTVASSSVPAPFRVGGVFCIRPACLQWPWRHSAFLPGRAPESIRRDSRTPPAAFTWTFEEQLARISFRSRSVAPW